MSWDNRTTVWEELPDFSPHEFNDGGPVMSKLFLTMLQQARNEARRICEALGFPEISFIINSGSRSPKRNRQVGGKPDSTHLLGLACDIRVVTSRERFVILRSLLLAGFTRIGIYDTFIHVDIGELSNEITKEPNVIWR